MQEHPIRTLGSHQSWSFGSVHDPSMTSKKKNSATTEYSGIMQHLSTEQVLGISQNLLWMLFGPYLAIGLGNPPF